MTKYYKMDWDRYLDAIEKRIKADGDTSEYWCYVVRTSLKKQCIEKNSNKFYHSIEATPEEVMEALLLGGLNE